MFKLCALDHDAESPVNLKECSAKDDPPRLSSLGQTGRQLPSESIRDVVLLILSTNSSQKTLVIPLVDSESMDGHLNNNCMIYNVVLSPHIRNILTISYM